MGRTRITVLVLTLLAMLPAAGCTTDPGRPAPGPSGGPARAEYVRHPVGSRELWLSRAGRPLRTVLLYPAEGPVGAPVRPGAAPAAGKFPLVLFSHGLRSSPERYVPTAASWTAAGFVVAMPAYPHTRSGAPFFSRKDIKNQPADAAYVIGKIRELGEDRADPLGGRIDTDHVAAVGHSAGGYTTTGLFVTGHDERLRAGVVLAGWMAPRAFHGPPATMLFMQGDSDPVVPIARGRAAYDRVPWSKSYVLLPRNFHAQYMLPGHHGYAQMDAVVTDFLLWTLTGDDAAHRRLPPSAFPTDAYTPAQR